MPSGSAENGQYLTTQFFGMKVTRYCTTTASARTRGQGRQRQELSGNGRALNQNAFRRKPNPEDRFSTRRCEELSNDQLHVCGAPMRAPGSGRDDAGRHRLAHTSKPVSLCARSRCAPRYGASRVQPTFAPAQKKTWRRLVVRARRRQFERPVSHRSRDVGRHSAGRTPTRREVITWQSVALCAH